MPKKKHPVIDRLICHLFLRPTYFPRRSHLPLKKMAAVLGIEDARELEGNPELVDLALRIACVRGLYSDELG